MKSKKLIKVYQVGTAAIEKNNEGKLEDIHCWARYKVLAPSVESAIKLAKPRFSLSTEYVEEVTLITIMG
jgi:uncharacterized protein YjhX (UPF0386 family)